MRAPDLQLPAPEFAAGISKLEQLEELGVSGTPFDDGACAALAPLTRLQRLE